MASATTVQEIIDYYTDLLIIQYHNKPKAQETIGLFVQALLANGILFDIRDAYALPTAVGVQLDVIGKYAGVDRFYVQPDLDDYFSITTAEVGDVDALPIFGFSNYTNFGTLVSSGTLTYNSIIDAANKLLDEAYRTIINLKIIQNYSNHSHKSINDEMYRFFGLDVVPESVGNMHMYYFITKNLTSIIKAAVYKQLLPRPMTVGLTTINNVDGLMFGFNTDSQLITGFSTYTDYGTVDRQTLIYSQIG
jgi:hypothetical protein